MAEFLESRAAAVGRFCISSCLDSAQPPWFDCGDEAWTDSSSLVEVPILCISAPSRTCTDAPKGGSSASLLERCGGSCFDVLDLASLSLRLRPPNAVAAVLAAAAAATSPGCGVLAATGVEGAAAEGAASAAAAATAFLPGLEAWAGTGFLGPSAAFPPEGAAGGL